VEGLEPTRLAASEPKSGASTNFATPATGVSLSEVCEVAQVLSLRESEKVCLLSCDV
jgi:hypothetical protein